MLHLCSVYELSGALSENRRKLYRQNEVQETQLSLFPIHSRLPKLDVARSTAVSRSLFSTTYEDSLIPRYSVYSIKPLEGFRSGCLPETLPLKNCGFQLVATHLEEPKPNLTN